MADLEITYSAINSDRFDPAELTDHNFFDKLSIGHKLKNFKDQIGTLSSLPIPRTPIIQVCFTQNKLPIIPIYNSQMSIA